MRALDRRQTPFLRLSRLRWLVAHRLSLARKTPENPDPIPDHLLTGADVVRIFSNRDMGTGGLTPYGSIVRLDPEGTVEQLLKLSAQGQHASDSHRPSHDRKGYNWRTLSVACIGNTDERPLTEPQTKSLVKVVSELLPLGRELIGHTALPYASKDPNKRCPGQFLYLHAIETSAHFYMPMGWQEWDLAQRTEHAQRAGWEL